MTEITILLHLYFQEVHVKLYKQNLEHMLRDFYSTVNSIDPAIRPLFDAHVESALR